ncbi:hypothetical protein XPA_010417 [Xanthoria parietina]
MPVQLCQGREFFHSFSVDSSPCSERLSFHTAWYPIHILTMIRHLSSAIAAALSADRSSFAHHTAIILTVPALILCLWRLWKFTISPYFHPYSPKELPYWTPCTYSHWQMPALS